MKYRLIFVFISILTVQVFSQNLELISFATGFSQAVDIVTDGSSNLYVVEKAGRIKKVDSSGVTASLLFLNITDRVLANSGERGLLGLTFHPQFPDSAYIYCNYTGSGGSTNISRFFVPNSDSADASSEEIILNFSQPYANHNGGDLAFDDEGYLMIASGDGGSGGDPQNQAQNLNSLLGKILRVNVDAALPYGIPTTNPFVGIPNVREEIWAYGLRNPWRIDFDDVTDALYVGDVGQNAFEEISVLNTGVSDPNYGWRCYEGNEEYNVDSCEGVVTIPPVHIYPHRSGPDPCSGSVTGGVVYRGSDMPGFSNRYFYADYCLGFIASLDLNNNYHCDTLYSNASSRFFTFGKDAQGRVYVANNNGIIYRLAQSTPPPPSSFIFTINLDGTQSGTGSSATGYGIATYDSTSNLFTVSGVFNDLIGSPTASHVHKAPAGSNGGVVFGLTRTTYTTDSIGFYGQSTLTETQEADLLVGDGYYVNIHSSMWPGGEIRGQIIRVDCPLNYNAFAPILPEGEYRTMEVSGLGALTNNRSMTIKYEDSALLIEGFEVELGSTLEILQEVCP